MADEQQDGRLDAAGIDKHAQVMERYRALDLQIDRNGVVQLTSDQQRRLFAFGYTAEGMAPAHLSKSWKKVAEAIELIQGMGIPALGNLEYIYEVGGKLTAMHKLCLAACQATGEMLKHQTIWVNAESEQLSEKNVIGFKAAGCVVRVRRKNYEEDAIGAFTMDDAKDAGLLARNKIWSQYPREMLMHRASMRALTQHFADVLAGVRCKELEEYNQVLSSDGQPVRTADGVQVYQRRLQQQQAGAQAFEQLKGGE